MLIKLDYAVNCKPRYAAEPHAGLFRILNEGRERYANRLKAFARTAGDYGDVPGDPQGVGPYWLNGFFSPLDAIALTGMIQEFRPALYVEIGSGNSTKFARRAVRLYSPKTRILSIDPEPRAEIDAICDEVIRKPLEAVDDLSVFDRLQRGDFLFVDNSHRCLMNSDVTVTFLDVLPRLRPGVIVHIHDIFLPWDYPQQWVERYYSEQYLLACYLLAGQRLRVELPNMFICRDKDLTPLLEPFWPHVASPQRDGGSFWFSVGG